MQSGWMKKVDDFKDVNRVEVIDRFGRSYSNWNVEDVEFSLQNDGRTLKIFLKDNLRQSVECDI